MGQITKAGNPQAYGYISTDVIPNGAFACWDPTAQATGQSAAGGAARPISAIGSSGAWFLGVFQGQVPIASNIDNSAPQALSYKILVQRAGIFPFLTTAGETYVHGTPLYAVTGGGGLTVTNSGSGNTAVGFANLPDGSTLTGATGVTVPVEIINNGTYSTNALLSA